MDARTYFKHCKKYALKNPLHLKLEKISPAQASHAHGQLLIYGTNLIYELNLTKMAEIIILFQ